MSANKKAVLVAVLVTFLWSTSWVLIKIGLGALPPLTFAGLRYLLASVILLPWLARPASWTELKKISSREVAELILFGLVYFTMAQGAQFLALAYLPANTLSLMLTLSSVVIAMLGMIFLAEHVTGTQWLGILIALAGAFLYFGRFSGGSGLGLAWGALCLLSTSIGAVQGRAVNRRLRLSPFLITLISMGTGASVLLAAGLILEPVPSLSPRDLLIIVWLALVNTALAFVLWNYTLRTLPVALSSVINNTMLIQIAVLVWIFLGERINLQQAIGLLVAAFGTLLVQWQRKQKPALAGEEAVS